MKKLFSLTLVLLLICSLAACGSETSDSKSKTNSDAANVNTSGEKPVGSNENSEQDTDTDSRGIPGMDPFALKVVLSSDPFFVPVAESKPADPNNTCAATCTSSGHGDMYDVIYDYSLSLDEDDEIVSAQFGLTNNNDTAEMVQLAADLYFSAVSMMKYDTANQEELGKWFSENLAHVSNSSALTTTVGDATYELYGIPGSAYWVEISRAL